MVSIYTLRSVVHRHSGEVTKMLLFFNSSNTRQLQMYILINTTMIKRMLFILSYYKCIDRTWIVQNHRNLIFLVFHATFINISTISWRTVVLVEEAGKNHRPWASNWEIYHLRLRVECTFFVIFKAGCEPTPYRW